MFSGKGDRMKLVFDNVILFPEEFYYTYQNCGSGQLSHLEHSHDFFEFFWIDEGTAVHKINSREELLKPGTIRMIRPRDTHSLRCAEKSPRLAFFNCNIKANLFLTFFHLLSKDSVSLDDMPQSLQLPEEQFRGLSEKCRKLLVLEDNFNSNLVRLEGAALILEIMTCFLRSYIQDRNLVPQWLNDLLGKMREPENLREGVPRFFELAERSREHVSRSMRRFYGISPREYILTLKLKNAAQELIGTDHSVTAIAYACGFNNLAYFHTAFSARYHTTPGKYRKTYGK